MIWNALLSWALANWLGLATRVVPPLVLVIVLGLDWATGSFWSRAGLILAVFNGLYVVLVVAGKLPNLPTITTPIK